MIGVEDHRLLAPWHRGPARSRRGSEGAANAALAGAWARRRRTRSALRKCSLIASSCSFRRACGSGGPGAGRALARRPGPRRDPRDRRETIRGDRHVERGRSPTTSSRGTQPRRSITQPWPEINAAGRLDVRTSGRHWPGSPGCARCPACSAVLVRSSGWNCGGVGEVLGLAQAADLGEPDRRAGVDQARPDVQSAQLDGLGLGRNRACRPGRSRRSCRRRRPACPRESSGRRPGAGVAPTRAKTPLRLRGELDRSDSGPTSVAWGIAGVSPGRAASLPPGSGRWK